MLDIDIRIRRRCLKMTPLHCASDSNETGKNVAVLQRFDAQHTRPAMPDCKICFTGIVKLQTCSSRGLWDGSCRHKTGITCKCAEHCHRRTSQSQSSISDTTNTLVVLASQVRSVLLQLSSAILFGIACTLGLLQVWLCCRRIVRCTSALRQGSHTL